jgi:hypothetical protein
MPTDKAWPQEAIILIRQNLNITKSLYHSTQNYTTAPMLELRYSPNYIELVNGRMYQVNSPCSHVQESSQKHQRTKSMWMAEKDLQVHSKPYHPCHHPSRSLISRMNLPICSHDTYTRWTSIPYTKLHNEGHHDQCKEDLGMSQIETHPKHRARLLCFRLWPNRV